MPREYYTLPITNNVPTILRELNRILDSISRRLIFTKDTNAKMYFGLENNVSLYYDGESWVIKTDEITASDIKLITGANKTLLLDTPVWDDARTPISVAKKIPGKEPAEVVYRGGIVYEFNTGNDEGCAFNVQFSHSRKSGSDIEFHIHYILRAAGAGAGVENIKWDFTYSWADINDAMPAETTVSKTIDVQDKSADTHYLGEIVGTIDGSDITGVSSMLICSLTRDVSVADNYSDDVLVMELDFHFQVNTLGSRQKAIK